MAKQIKLVTLMVVLLALPSLAREPVIELNAEALAGLKEKVGQTVVVQGKVRSAEWSQTGRVMNIFFEGLEDTAFAVVVFERSRKTLDEAFGGDMSAAVKDKTLRVRGQLRTFGGRAAALKDRLEITVENSEQISLQ